MNYVKIYIEEGSTNEFSKMLDNARLGINFVVGTVSTILRTEASLEPHRFVVRHCLAAFPLAERKTENRGVLNSGRSGI